ncbi:MAG: fumarate hydratase C-terminal domain-containing protein [Methanomassiliicoccales archaeon]|jgi:fumarate hydratase subunit beta|nr:fumarate hydratase C-terminal domain-containing protein [Methanomassiliicoccales archaeon]
MILSTPLSEELVRSLRVGDTVRLNGIIYTGRDEVHRRALEMHERGEKLPVDLKGAALFHCGPIMKNEGSEWKVLAAGPTTSARMNALEPKFIEIFGVRAIIGKGGMSRQTVDAMKRFGCVYLAVTGGAAVTTAKSIKKVVGVEWFDLGMPEALWIFEVKDFGPLIVAIDTNGESLYEQVERNVMSNLLAVRQMLGLKRE